MWGWWGGGRRQGTLPPCRVEEAGVRRPWGRGRSGRPLAEAQGAAASGAALAPAAAKQRLWWTPDGRRGWGEARWSGMERGGESRVGGGATGKAGVGVGRGSQERSHVSGLLPAGRRGTHGGGWSARHLLGLRGGASGRRPAVAQCPGSQGDGFPAFRAAEGRLSDTRMGSGAQLARGDGENSPPPSLWQRKGWAEGGLGRLESRIRGSLYPEAPGVPAGASLPPPNPGGASGAGGWAEVEGQLQGRGAA